MSADTKIATASLPAILMMFLSVKNFYHKKKGTRKKGESSPIAASN